MPNNKEVMQAMQGQHGQGRDIAGHTKGIRQIIDESIPHNTPPAKFWGGIVFMLKDPNNKLLQIGNTVFLLKRIAPDTVESHIFSKEPVKTIVNRYLTLTKTLKSQGLKKLISYTNQPGHIKLAQQSGFPVKITQGTKKMGNQMVPMYMMELDL